MQKGSCIDIIDMFNEDELFIQKKIIKHSMVKKERENTCDQS